MSAGVWAVLAVGMVLGVALAVMSGAVRDAVLDVVDDVADMWWAAVDAVRRFLLGVCVAVTSVLAAVGVWHLLG